MASIKELFGKRVRELRKEKNLTQEQLAELIGIDPRNIIKIENAQTFPRIQTLEKLLQVFEISPNEIFNSEHLNDTKILLARIINKLENNDDLVRFVYKILF